MKKHLLLCLLLPLLFIWSGCKKEMLDFSHLKIQADGEYGIPIINTTYTIEDILAQLDNNEYVVQNADGQLFLNYSFDEIKVVTDIMLLSFSDEATDYEWKETISENAGVSIKRNSTFVFKIPDTRVIIRRGTVMRGYLNLKMSGNMGSATISCQELKDAAGQPFMKTITGNNYQERIDLSKYTVSCLYDHINEINMTVALDFQGTGAPQDYVMNLNVSTQDLRLRECTGKVKSYTGEYSDVLNFGSSFDRSRYGGSLTLYNPKITLHIKNSFNWTGGTVFVDKLCFKGQHNSSDLVTYPSSIEVLGGMNTEQDIKGFASVYYSDDFNKLEFAGRAIVNPQGVDIGEVNILENSALSVKATIGIPFDIKSDYLYYQDTIDFNIGSGGNLPEVIQKIVFRYVLGNALPFNVNAQIYFYNSVQKTLLDSLFHPYLQLGGAFQGKMIETASVLEIEQNRIDKVLSANKIIFRFRINTDGNRVFVNAKDGLKVALGMKFKLETDDLIGIFKPDSLTIK